MIWPAAGHEKNPTFTAFGVSIACETCAANDPDLARFLGRARGLHELHHSGFDCPQAGFDTHASVSTKCFLPVHDRTVMRKLR